jgi:hypothetical protein
MLGEIYIVPLIVDRFRDDAEVLKTLHKRYGQALEAPPSIKGLYSQ